MLRAKAPAVRVLALASNDDVTLFRTAIGRGAHGVILKTDPATALIEAIRQLHRGQIWLSCETASRLIPDLWFVSPSLPNEAETAKISQLTHASGR